jgi:hypothetical protein
MTIVRAPRPSEGFTILRNENVRNQTLTFRARGLLAYLLSMPDNWATNSERLQSRWTEGRDAIRSSIKELEAAGYMTLHKAQNDKGQWVSNWIVTDHPRMETHVKRLAVLVENLKQPTPEKPTSDNQALIEELTNKNMVQKSETCLETLEKLCGYCRGTGHDLDDPEQIHPCPQCRGDGISR